MTTEEIIQKVRKHAEMAVREELDRCRRKIEQALGEVYTEGDISRASGRSHCSTHSPEGKKLWAYFSPDTNSDLPDFLVAAEFDRRLRGLAKDRQTSPTTPPPRAERRNDDQTKQ